jgi:hypothetical protein
VRLPFFHQSQDHVAVALARAAQRRQAVDHVGRLIGRNTYGYFAELAAYEWLMRCRVSIQTQVAMTPKDVLAAKGSTLDGKFNHDGTFLT